MRGVDQAMSKQDVANLKRRYLVWFYKATKEALDKIDRKFTQVEIDRFLIKELKKSPDFKAVKKRVLEFEAYVATKVRDGQALKFKNGSLTPEYAFLELKLKAIEKAIKKEFGAKGLAEIKSLYEREMTERILRSIEH
jgi:hypothetical protein